MKRRGELEIEREGRGELEIEREGRGDRAKVWVLAPGLSSDAPGGQPVDAGPSPEADLAAAREQARALQELADYRGKLLDEADWRYRELLEELRRSQAMQQGLTRCQKGRSYRRSWG